jgi:hypothetical protein
MVFAMINRRKLFGGKGLRRRGPAPPTLSRCGVRVYVDLAIGVEVVPLLSLVGLTIVLVPHVELSTIVTRRHDQIILNTTLNRALANVTKFHDKNSKKKKEKKRP